MPRGLRLPDLLTVSDETDEHGRLLLEDSAPKQAQKRATRAGVPMDTARWQQRDTPSRLGGLMNVSAYEALRRDTAEVLAGFAWLGARYFEQEPSARGRVEAVADISKLGTILPLVLFHRADDPVRRHRGMPSFVASLFKASRGVFSATFDMLNRSEGATDVTAAEVVRFADDHGHLKRPDTGRVCAAPTRLIERTIHVILTGQGAEADRSRLGEFVDFAMLWQCHRLERAFHDGLNRYRYVLERIMGSGLRSPAEWFACGIEIGGQTQSFGEFTESFLSYANGLQADLNRALGRAGNAPPLKFDDVMQLM